MLFFSSKGDFSAKINSSSLFNIITGFVLIKLCLNWRILHCSNNGLLSTFIWIECLFSVPKVDFPFMFNVVNKVHIHVLKVLPYKTFFRFPLLIVLIFSRLSGTFCTCSVLLFFILNLYIFLYLHLVSVLSDTCGDNSKKRSVLRITLM